jgi:phosphoenolpyruvate synthase/pyruvate phosphate dikinase
MQRFVFPFTAKEATDASRFGPKAANLARLGHAGLPIPEGFCVDAQAYRTQIRVLGLEAHARGVFSALEGPQARRHALMMKLGRGAQTGRCRCGARGSTSHMASLARERGIPMVLWVLDATLRIPDGSTVAVDRVAPVVRWMN